MKKFIIFTSVVVMSYLISCSKSEENVNCSAVYILPSLNFQVINKDNNTDYFFSSAPAHNTSDLKVYFKNAEFWSGGVSQVQVVSTPPGWIGTYISGNQLSAYCNNASGTLEVNLLTPCGWVFCRFSIYGV
jgi:hypothetical protein